MSKQTTYQKGKLSKLLIAITLFVSVFSFSGDFGNAAPSKTKSFQTELRYSSKSTISKAVSYSKALASIFAESNAIDLCYNNRKHIALFHNRLFQTRLKICAKTSFSNLDSKLPIKVVPQTIDEDASPAHRG